MFPNAHRLSRVLVNEDRTFKLSLEISGATGAVYEGSVFEHGSTIQKISAAPGDTADTMKSKLLHEAYAIAGQVAENPEIGDWTYEELNLDGSPAAR